jgi:two-component system nitrate/nitrite sensor histidine kinase NarX
MLSGFVRGDRSQTDSRYQVVLDRWQRVIKPSITNRTTQVAEISSFVEDIEWLVQAYQREAEQKIEWLRIIQLAALFLTLTLVYFSLHSVHHNIAQPLRELAQMARKISADDFTHRAIQLLYDTAKKLNENKQEASDFSDIIDELSDIVGVKDIDLCLMTANGEVPSRLAEFH